MLHNFLLLSTATLLALCPVPSPHAASLADSHSRLSVAPANANTPHFPPSSSSSSSSSSASDGHHDAWIDGLGAREKQSLLPSPTDDVAADADADGGFNTQGIPGARRIPRHRSHSREAHDRVELRGEVARESGISDGGVSSRHDDAGIQSSTVNFDPSTGDSHEPHSTSDRLKGEEISLSVSGNAGGSLPRNVSYNRSPLSDASELLESENSIRGIMENFADDFESPPDTQLSDDFFNREPYYYDAYYDNFPNTIDTAAPDIREDDQTHTGDSNIEPPGKTLPVGNPLRQFKEDKLGGIAANTLNDRSPASDDLSDMEDDLDLRLLGADLQAELGFVLEQLTNGSQRNRRHQAPVRHTDTRQQHHGGISVGVRDGACPPPVHSLPPGLCGAPPCTSHMMCFPERMCCFNGCTYTCTHPVRPPPVIDWIEDTGSRLPLLDPSNPSLPLRFESSPLSYGTGGGETVRLPGGCSLTSDKYGELKQFMAADSIQDCLCSGGEVVCVVKSSPGE